MLTEVTTGEKASESSKLSRESSTTEESMIGNRVFSRSSADSWEGLVSGKRLKDSRIRVK
jgi:hypothetical protein